MLYNLLRGSRQKEIQLVLTVCFVRLSGKDFVAKFLAFVISCPLQIKSYSGKYNETNCLRPLLHKRKKIIKYLILSQTAATNIHSHKLKQRNSKSFLNKCLFLYLVFYVFYSCVVFIF